MVTIGAWIATRWSHGFLVAKIEIFDSKKKIHSKRYIASWCIQDGQLYLKKFRVSFWMAQKLRYLKYFPTILINTMHRLARIRLDAHCMGNLLSGLMAKLNVLLKNSFLKKI